MRWIMMERGPRPRWLPFQDTFVIFLLIASASASHAVVDSLESPLTLFVSPLGHDTPPGDGSMSNPFQTLHQALQVAGNASDVTVHLLPGIYASAKDLHLEPAGHGRLLITGESATVDLSVFGSPFLTIVDGPAEVSLSNVTVMNGWGDSAVKIASLTPSVSIVGVNFFDNTFNSLEGTGAAVFVAQGLTMKGPLLSNCHFRNNTSGRGGAVLLMSAARIQGCTFETNQATNPAYGGGAVAVAPQILGSGKPLLSNSIFLNNVATGGGGAVNLASTALIEGCTFEGNTAATAVFGGGGVYVNADISGEGLFLSNSNFTNNSAIGGGGGVFLGAAARIDGCIFHGNSAATLSRGGGGVSVNVDTAPPFLSNCSFQNNTASAGGAVNLGSKARFENCSFEGNTATNPSYGGGSVWLNPGINRPLDGPLLSNCSFRSNTAFGFGGAVFLGSAALLEFCVFESNSAPSAEFGGAGVFVASMQKGSEQSMLSHCSFWDNAARGVGGAVFLGSVTHIMGCLFERNLAGNPSEGGGGVFVNRGIHGEGPLLSNCTFRNNTVSGGGGAVILGSVARIDGCVFEGNTAASPSYGGGGVFVNGGLGTDVPLLSNCTFQNNFALVGLGGAMTVGSGLQIHGCVFESNTALVGGGAALTTGTANVTFHGSIFAHNIARHPGGGAAIWISQAVHVALLSCALCDADAVGSVVCDPSVPAQIEVTGSSAAVNVSQMISSDCQVLTAAGTPFELSGHQLHSRMFGAVCGQGRATLLYTTWQDHGANITVPKALTSMAVTVTSLQGTRLAVTPAMRNTSSPTELLGVEALSRLEPVVVSNQNRQATKTVSNLDDGRCSQGCFPTFGIRVESPLDVSRYVATAFLLEVAEEGLGLSLERSEVDIVGFPFAWVGLNTLFLVRLRNQLGGLHTDHVRIRVDGQDALCEHDGNNKATAIHLCSVTFHHEGEYSLDLLDGTGTNKIGTLQQTIMVVSLAWPIAIGVVLLLAAIVTSGWVLLKAWRRRRQHIANKLLAHYVGLGPLANSSDPLEALLESDSGHRLLDKSFLIPFSDIDIRRAIAAGAAGKVSLGTWKGTSVAVKRLYTLPTGLDGEDERVAFVKELSVHKSLRHPNVVQLLGVCANPLCIVLEFMERGSLFACLQEKESTEMPWPLRLRCVLDIARAMSYAPNVTVPDTLAARFLHAEGVLHRDLKSLNVLINEDWRCKVADFDQSRVESDTLTAMVGTVLWSAPEVLERKGSYGKSADVYSFGIVMWECWTREAPFQGRSAPNRGQVQAHIIAGGRPVCAETPGEPPEVYRELMHSCWDGDRTKRPVFSDVVAVLEARGGELVRAVQEPIFRGAAAAEKTDPIGTLDSAPHSTPFWQRVLLSATHAKHHGLERRVSESEGPLAAPLLPVVAQPNPAADTALSVP